MRYVTTVLFATLLLFSAVRCGPSEEEIASRKELAKGARQVSAVYRSIGEGNEREGSLNRIQMPSFYDEYINDLDEVRSTLVSADLVAPYRTGRQELDSVLTLTKAVIKERQDVMSALFDASSSMSDYTRNMKLAREAEYSSNRIDWYNDAEEASTEFSDAQKEMREERTQLDSAAAAAFRAVRQFNDFAADNEIQDTLSGTNSLNRHSAEMRKAIAILDSLEIP